MRLPLALTALALLAACGHKDDPVGAASPEEDRMLNEAASSLDVTPDNAAIDNTAQPTPQGNAQ
ncbi:hypothetical protein [Sphingomonas sp.]|jgi:hypothetical protein|uniref:hypothetical protein n=1 Tax=Sphingomonas sp. TaxID=28214 RepID=UPI002E2FA9F6|nr:hypothetical protein [Sphingomonas sp.]HEX4693218.1 hypothetical protein [Sphingomonas sp.]